MFKRQLVVSIQSLFLLVAVSQIAIAQMDLAKEAYKKGDYTTAYNEWLKRADGGDPEAQFNLGYMTDNGQGIAPDHFSAARWYELAARQNYPAARQLLQKILLKIRTEEKKNLKTWLPKAQEGDPASQLALSEVLAAGKIVEKDNIEALKWLLLALENIENGTLKKRMLRFEKNLKQRMNNDEILEAKIRISDWKTLNQ